MAPLTTLSLFSAHETSSCMKEEKERELLQELLKTIWTSIVYKHLDT
jgi:hypothetical protein